MTKRNLLRNSLLASQLVVGCSLFEGNDLDSLKSGSSGSAISDRDFQTLTYSMSQNPLTGKVYSLAEARKIELNLKLVIQKETDPIKEKKPLQRLITIQDLLNIPLNTINPSAQKIAALELRSGVDRDISDYIKLDLMLAALKQKKYSLAEFYLDELNNTKFKPIKAACENARGVMAFQERRIPEAVNFWREALKIDKEYESSLLNLGFVSLIYGNFELAKKLLEKLPGDWFAQSGLAISLRYMGENASTAQICDKLLESHSDHKAIVFNCGIFQWQNQKNIALAQQLIKKAIALPGGISSWNDDGKQILAKVK